MDAKTQAFISNVFLATKAMILEWSDWNEAPGTYRLLLRKGSVVICGEARDHENCVGCVIHDAKGAVIKDVASSRAHTHDLVALYDWVHESFHKPALDDLLNEVCKLIAEPRQNS